MAKERFRTLTDLEETDGIRWVPFFRSLDVAESLRLVQACARGMKRLATAVLQATAEAGPAVRFFLFAFEDRDR